MRKKAGFTLIELLSVIVLIAIILLITVPIIYGVIEKYNKEASIASIRSYVEEINSNNSTYLINKKGKLITSNDVEDIKLDNLKGSKPITGQLNYTNKNLVSDGIFCINGYEIKYENKKYSVINSCLKTMPEYKVDLKIISDKEYINELYFSYNDEKYFDIIPTYGYYFHSASCTNNYSISLETGFDKYREQFVKISNNKQKKNAICVIDMKKRVSFVTYIVDDKTYREDIQIDKTVLSPTTFSIDKSGYKFIGWSETQNGTILTSKLATGNDMTLYAVYKSTTSNNLTSGGIYMNPNADHKHNYTSSGWLNGSQSIYAAGQTITVSAYCDRYDFAIGGYLDIYVRNASNGARTKLGRVMSMSGSAQEKGWGSGVGIESTTFKMPNDDNSYYIDYFGWGIGYYTGTHKINFIINSTKVS